MEPSSRRPDDREHDKFQAKDSWNRFIESRHWGSGLPEPGGPPRVSVCVCLCVCLCFCLCLRLCLCLHTCVCLSPLSLSPSVPLSLCLSASLPLCLYLSLSLPGRLPETIAGSSCRNKWKL